MKKHLSLLLCLLMLVSMFSVLTVQSSAAAASVTMKFNTPTSVHSLSAGSPATYAVGYVNTFYWNNGSLVTRGTGTAGFDADEGAAWISGPSNGSTIYSARAYMLNYGDAFKTQDYRYAKIRVKADAPGDVTLKILVRTSDRVSTNGYKDITVATGYKAADGWIEKVIDLNGQSWYTGNYDVYQSGNSSNSDEAFFVQFDANTTKLTNKNFKGYVQYLAFFKTEAEAKAYQLTSVPSTVEMKFDNPEAAWTLGGTNGVYAGTPQAGSHNGLLHYDAAERSLYFTPEYSQIRNSTSNYVFRANLSNPYAISGDDYRFVKLRYKIVTDELADKAVNVTVRNHDWQQNTTIMSNSPVNEWVEVLYDLGASKQWNNRNITGPGKYFRVQLTWADTTVNVYEEDDFRFYVQYVSFFTDKATAEAYTYTPSPETEVPTGKSVIIPMNLPKYSYVLGGNRYSSGMALISHSFGADSKGTVAFDEKEQSIYITASEEVAVPTQARFVIRGAQEIKGADYPYVKLCYKITNYTPAPIDWLSIRDNNWYTYVLTDEALRTDEWVTLTVNMGALVNSNKALGATSAAWKSAVIGGNVGSSANDLRIQLWLNDGANYNITKSEDARFYLKYVAFFQTKAEAEAFTYTAQPETPAADPIVWKFDNHNAVKASASKLGGAYVSAVAGANSSSSTFAYDKDEKAVVVTPSATGNSYYAQIRINNNGAAFAGKDYPVGKIRFKIEGDAAETYRVNFRSAAWSTHPIISSVKPGEWVEVTFDLTVLQDTTARQWFNTTVQNCGDPYAANNADLSKYGAILQFENIAGHNIHSDKNFRVCLQYLGFFPSEEAAKAHTPTPLPTSAACPTQTTSWLPTR